MLNHLFLFQVSINVDDNIRRNDDFSSFNDDFDSFIERTVLEQKMNVVKWCR